MRVVCQNCHKGMDFSEERPSFCAFCGKALDKSSTTVSYRNEGSSDASSLEETQTPPAHRPITFGAYEPEQIGEYQIIRRLGSGGMGAVYEAIDKHSNRRVAIKIIKPSVAASALNLDRFRQEGRLASLIAHPRCVFVYKADEETGRPYIVMELMPGATLKDLVTAQGSLGIGQAIRKILDVIDGLLAAHEIGVIHRDVKPSNCFVMTDGRVKIGDFGLSKLLREEKEVSPHDSTKSHENDGYLTRTGSFIGTPLYASPEQIKGEPVDFRTDIYSVSATLFYLLTGKAPFEGGDATATVARIVTEDPPSIKEFRKDVSSELEKVLETGLAVDKQKRFSSIHEFRAALEPLVPGQVKTAPRMSRVRAGIVDAILLSPILLLLGQIVPRCSPDNLSEVERCITSESIQWLVVFLYYFILETWMAASLGKKLLALRVCGPRPGKPAGRKAILRRSLFTIGLIAIPGLTALALTQSFWIQWAIHAGVILILADSIRSKGGYRGFHDKLTSTSVEELPWVSEAVTFPTFTGTTTQPLPDGFPRELGSFVLEGIRGWRGDTLYVVGKDQTLDRGAWVMLHPGTQAPVTSRRREISRSTRLRWLGSGVEKFDQEAARRLMPRNPQTTWSWDAFLAPVNGCALNELVEKEGPLNWAQGSVILEQLCEELDHSIQDGTFPEQLTPGQIWLQSDGQILLIGTTFEDESESVVKDHGSPTERAMRFLREASQVMLEGKTESHLSPADRLESPVPLYVRPIFDMLFDVMTGYKTPDELGKALRAVKSKPKTITVPIRLGHLLLVSMLISPFILAMFVIARYFNEIEPTLVHTVQVRQLERSLRWVDQPDNTTGMYQHWVREEKISPIFRPSEVHLIQSFAGWLSPEQRDKTIGLVIQGMLKKQQLTDSETLRTLQQRLSQVALIPYTLVVDWIGSAEWETDPLHNRETNPMLWRVLRRIKSENPEKASEWAFFNRLSPKQWALLTIIFWPALWTTWAFLFRGGLTYRLMGIDLLNAKGNPAPRWRCAWRNLVIWIPIAGLLILSVLQQSANPSSLFISWVIWWLAVILIAAAAFWTLFRSRRSMHDILSGVYLVPK